jgi:hypothetical protein
MLKVLYGSFEINSKIDYIKLPFKIIYIIYTAPFLLFTFLMYIRSLGAFGNPLKEKYGTAKIIMVHFAAIAFSFGMWVLLLSVLESNFDIKVRLHF